MRGLFMSGLTFSNGLKMANTVKNKGSFKKGWKGGPGRPKGSRNLEWCREFAEGEGKEKLRMWARSQNPKASMQALTLIFAYGFGKPTEHLEHDVTLDLRQLVMGSFNATT